MFASLTRGPCATARTCWTARLLGLLLLAGPYPAIPDDAPDPLTEEITRGTRFALQLGGHAWPAMADLESSIGGAFDDWGLDIEVNWHVKARAPRRWLWGVDLGLFFTESNIPGQSSDLSARGMYLTPSIKLPVAATGLFYLDAGLGLYIVDFAELDCESVNFCFEAEEKWEATRLGGYLGASMDILPRPGSRFRGSVGFKIHYADFGTPNGIGPSPGTLDGPIVMLLLGVAM